MTIRKFIRAAIIITMINSGLIFGAIGVRAQENEQSYLKLVVDEYAAKELRESGLAEQPEGRKVYWPDAGKGHIAIVDMLFETGDGGDGVSRRAMIASFDDGKWTLKQSELEGDYYVQALKMGDLYLVRLTSKDPDVKTSSRAIERWHLDEEGNLLLTKRMAKDEEDDEPREPKTKSTWLH